MNAPVKSGLAPVDAAFSKHVVQPTVPLWRSLGATPNNLTTLSAISSAASLYGMVQSNVLLAGLCAFMRVYFDYADGILARTYNLESEFGDFYDHAVDVVYFSSILLVVLARYKGARRIIVFSLCAVLLLASATNIMCIEDACTTCEHNTTLLTVGKPMLHVCRQFPAFRHMDSLVLTAAMIGIVLATLPRRK